MLFSSAGLVKAAAEALGGKGDAIPGNTNFIWLTPNSTGEFPGQCYQLCGYSHANMRERAIIQPQADFDAWLTAEQRPGVQPTASDAGEGAQFFQTSTCQGCHTVNGTSAQGKIGPNLTHFASLNYDLVIGVGFLMAEAVGTVSGTFPNIHFAIIDGAGTDAKGNDLKLPNVESLFFKEQDAGAMVGVIAGMLTKDKLTPNKSNVISAVLSGESL